MRYFLDTHVLLNWLADRSKLSKKHRSILKQADAENPLWLSDISLWEIATLHSLGRIELSLGLDEFLDKLVALPQIAMIRISAAVAAEVAALPDRFHRDPGDRIIVASAKVIKATLLTQDKKIIDAAIVETL